MCGIVGYVSVNSYSLLDMLEQIKHRGPDSNGEKVFEVNNNFKVGLGHNRLSIIDVSDNSSQPFSSIGNYCIVFNGEIYNFKELKKKYLRDFNFISSGDTEVIIELYKQYGTQSFQWLEGMFAFVIFDRIKSKLILSRDALGIKPLYFYYNKNELFFASEISVLKSIKHLDVSICPKAVTEFFLNGFIYEPDTGFQKIKKIFPGTTVEVSIDESISISSIPFWKPNQFQSNQDTDISNLIKKEHEKHLVSDVPVGLFYSGGIDSSLLLSLSDDATASFFIQSKNNTTSKDLTFATEIAKNLNKDFTTLNLSISENNVDEIISTIVNVASKSEELTADYTFQVSEMISMKARENGLKVMLSGMGGDELFLGYPRYKLLHYKSIYYIIYKLGIGLLSSNKRFSKKIDRFKAFFANKSFVLKYTNLIGYFQEDELDSLLVNFDSTTLKDYEIKLNSFLNGNENLADVKKAQILDLYGFLSHNFMVADKSSMRASIEMRVPLATPALFDATLRMPVRHLMNFFNAKIPLLYILKQKINLTYFKRPKEGFNPDLENLVNVIGAKRIFEILDSGIFFKYVQADYVRKIVNDHFNGSKNNSYKVYQLLYFKFWLEKNA